MTTLSVKAKNIVYNRGAAPIFPIQEYVGELIPNPGWLSNDFLCLTTDDSKFNFRIIPKKNVVSINDKTYSQEQENKKHVFVCKGSKGNEYTVIKNNTKWTCTCVGFEFRKDCKHIKAASKMLNKCKE